MVINTNIPAQNGARLLTESSALLAKSLARLSSGSKIISPEDDAAGLAVSTRFDAQIHRVGAANSNVNNALSFSQTQDGFLSKVGKALDRMSELALLAQDATKADADRALYNTEFSTLAAYISNVGSKDFNGISLFSNGTLNITTDSDGNFFTMNGISLVSSAYSSTYVAAQANISTTSSAATALAIVKSAVTQLAADRSTVGANMQRLRYTTEQLTVLRDNLTAANSRIKDVDVADESTQFAKWNILVQAGTAMLAQANAMPTSALRLLQ
jgi:flagellin